MTETLFEMTALHQIAQTADSIAVLPGAGIPQNRGFPSSVARPGCGGPIRRSTWERQRHSREPLPSSGCSSKLVSSAMAPYATLFMNVPFKKLRHVVCRRCE